MESILTFIHTHPGTSAFLGYVLFMAIVSGMPEPGPDSSVAYKWAYRTLHIVAVNLNFLWQKKGLPVLPGQTLQAQSTTAPDGTTQSVVTMQAKDPKVGE
jgi:hypothetical protein